MLNKIPIMFKKYVGNNSVFPSCIYRGTVEVAYQRSKTFGHYLLPMKTNLQAYIKI